MDARYQVFDWIVLPGNASDYCDTTSSGEIGGATDFGDLCDTWAIRGAASALLRETHGIDLNTNIAQYVINGWADQGLGGSGTTTLGAHWLQSHRTDVLEGTSKVPYVAIAHEMGHAFGLKHSYNLSYCENGAYPAHFSYPSSDCTSSRYGDSTMGGSAGYGFSVPQRIKSGLLGEETVLTIAPEADQQTLEIEEINIDSTNKKMIRFDSPYIPGDGYLFLEYVEENGVNHFDQGHEARGIKIGIKTPTGLNYAYFSGSGDSDVIYLTGSYLAEEGDEIAITSIGAKFSWVQTQNNVATIQYEKIPVDDFVLNGGCQEADPGYNHGGIGAADIDRIYTKSVDFINQNRGCGPREFDVEFTSADNVDLTYTGPETITLNDGQSFFWDFDYVGTELGYGHVGWTIREVTSARSTDRYVSIRVDEQPDDGCFKNHPDMEISGLPSSLRVGEEATVSVTYWSNHTGCTGSYDHWLDQDLYDQSANIDVLTSHERTQLYEGESASFDYTIRGTAAGLGRFSIRPNHAGKWNRRIIEVPILEEEPCVQNDSEVAWDTSGLTFPLVTGEQYSVPLVISNGDAGQCDPRSLQVSSEVVRGDLDLSHNPEFLQLNPGSSTEVLFDVSTESAGRKVINVTVEDLFGLSAPIEVRRRMRFR